MDAPGKLRSTAGARRADALASGFLHVVNNRSAPSVSRAPRELVSRDFTTVAALRDAGVRRISVGGALARAAWSDFFDAATDIAELGTFTHLARAVPGDRLNKAFDTK